MHDFDVSKGPSDAVSYPWHGYGTITLMREYELVSDER